MITKEDYSKMVENRDKKSTLHLFHTLNDTSGTGIRADMEGGDLDDIAPLKPQPRLLISLLSLNSTTLLFK